MDLTSDNCRKMFLYKRKEIRKKIEKADFDKKDDVTIDAFNDICLEAVDGDPIAQDVLSYIFKNGLGDVIPVNYEKYMQWQILAGANGNQFTLEKLSLFMSFAINEILIVPDFSYIVQRNNLTNQNYQYILGRLICEAIVDELNIEATKLIKDEVFHQEFSPKIMRIYDKARNFAIPKVLKFLRN